MPVKGNKFCEVCNKDIVAKHFAEHKKTKTHEQKAKQRGSTQRGIVSSSSETSGRPAQSTSYSGGSVRRLSANQWLRTLRVSGRPLRMPLNLWLDILLLGVIISWLLISYIINILSIEYSRIILHIIGLEMILLQKGIE